MAGYSYPNQQIYQPYSIHNTDNGIPLFNPVIEQSPTTNAIQAGNFGLQGAVRGSFQHGGSPSLLSGSSLLHPKLDQI